MDEETKLARERLAKRFGKKMRTGGKGTVRRKKKVRNKIKINRIEKEEKDFNILIDKLNNNIQNTKVVNKVKKRVFLNEWALDFCLELSRKDLSKKIIKNIEKIKEEHEEFFENYIGIYEDGIILFTKKYKKCKQLFTERGYDFLIDCLEECLKDLEKKKYLEDKEVKDKINIEECIDLLELSQHEIPSKTDIKKAYLKKSRVLHPDKHPNETAKYVKLFKELNKAYKGVLSYFYEKKVSNSGDVVE